MTNSHSPLGEHDEARASGTRALAIARRLEDLDLRILATTYLEQVQYFRGEYTRVLELATDNLAALPADRVCEDFLKRNAPPSVDDRFWLIMSLAQLGRFAEAAEHVAEALRLAEPRGMRPLVAHCHLGLGQLSRGTGKQDQAREHLATATTTYRDMDLRFWAGPGGGRDEDISIILSMPRIERIPKSIAEQIK